MTKVARPDIQRAWVNVRRGTPAEALVLKSDWPVSKKLAPGEVLLKVHAAALNPIGYKFFAVLPFFARRPRVPEYDLSGVVVDTNKTRFREGDEVYGWVPSKQFRYKEGALCQYVKVSEDWIVPRPHNVTPTQAAGLTLAGQTAYTALMRRINIQPGQHIFVNGGSTAVGAFAIQLAKIRGAKVTASASGRNEEFVRRMGADKFVDYTKESVLEYMESFARTSNSKFDYILEAVGIRSLRPIVDSVYDFDDALKAYDRIMSKRATGKVVVRVDTTSE
ncbi:hypothetical protein NLJ89_g8531 [Agrocybe chaxingu]|uniref:Enoyl reductase (ER) domain-containing protein n=1 Tax=Agrocybe chaxingu TaxID=84603 RepID=A0A9W8MQP1_9AGAR|nr:hypothetical protein NLJ89_g8531 [Agrocybe chaxingu]